MKRFLAVLLAVLFVFSLVSASAETVAKMTYTVILPDVTREGLYTGEVQNGVPNGYGVFVAQNSSGVYWHYLGEWVDGKMEGQGGQYWDSGKAVVGTFANNAIVTNEEHNTSTNDSNSAQTVAASAGEKNALRSATSYLSFMPFSYQGLIEQLEYEGYTTAEATYAADNCGADWNEQAAKAAKNYLSFMGFSKNGLIEQLEYEGFTHEQAVYGAEQNGY